MAAAARRSSGAQAEASRGASFSGDAEASAGSGAQQLQHRHSMGQLPSLGRSQQQQGAGTFARATRIGALGVNTILGMWQALRLWATFVCLPACVQALQGVLVEGCLCPCFVHTMLTRGRSGTAASSCKQPF